jgi:basic membrane lipoprotein Med (substrate-binding protein (PBP1-ABC) superfamily)
MRGERWWRQVPSSLNSYREPARRGLALVLALAAAWWLLACSATGAPAGQAGSKPSGSTGAQRLKVGLVTDIGGVNDKSFNQAAWTGLQKAMQELPVDARFIESKQTTDYDKNIDQFATEGYAAIVTVGFLLGDATASKAKQYPAIKFGIVEFVYAPAKPGDPDPYTTDLRNVTSLTFQDDEVSFLAGVAAGGMTKTDTVCTVAGMEIPPVVRLVNGYKNGAQWMKPAARALHVYTPSFTDPARGREAGQAMIGQGCDVVFGAGGTTGNGGLLAAKDNSVMAIGVDVDQYYTYPEVQSALLTSAMKNVDVAVFEYARSLVTGTAEAGVRTLSVKNDGIGLAPYHDWDARVPQAVKDKVKEAEAGLKSGSLTTGYQP